MPVISNGMSFAGRESLPPRIGPPSMTTLPAMTVGE